MPEWDYEANTCCAESCHSMGEYVCAEPEGYVFRTAIGALKKCERMKSVMTMLSIQAEQHKVILAEDIFNVLEDIFDDWSEEE